MTEDSGKGGEAFPGLEGIRAAASAPAKCILLGEHAVVYSEPCLSLAMARRTRVAAHRVGEEFRVDGYPLAKRHHAFILSALKQVWGDGGAVRFEVDSRVPSASGVGSSAALSVATVGALRRLKGSFDPPKIARDAFETERSAQGSGSPNDTSVSTAGGSVLLAPQKHDGGGLRPLWRVEREERSWYVHQAPTPEFADAQWVVGHTGVHAKTSRQVAKVARFVKRSGFAKDTIKTLGRLTWQGLDALREQDPEAFGKSMDQAHAQLVTLGVSHPSLERLVEAARRTPGTFGAKLTGAGGGGAMLVLTSRPKDAVRVLSKAGARTIVLEPSREGVRAEEIASGEGEDDPVELGGTGAQVTAPEVRGSPSGSKGKEAVS